MEERTFHPLDYVSVLRRRRWWFITPLAVCTVVGILLAIFWTGFLRVGSQISLFLAPIASVLLITGWLSLPLN